VSQPHLGRIAGDFIATVLLFESAPEAQRPESGVLRSRLLGALDQIAKHPGMQAIPADEFEQARFALVVWADEVVLRSEWRGRDEWFQDTLQLQLFRTNRGGNEFYERLELLRPEQNHAREIYFLCLCMGFEGQWAGHEPERRQIIQQQYEILRASGHAVEIAAASPLAPPAYDLEIDVGDGGGRGLSRIFLSWTGAALAIFGALWLILIWASSRMPTPPGT
jgi:type VI secretion system protein ImpK